MSVFIKNEYRVLYQIAYNNLVIRSGHFMNALNKGLVCCFQRHISDICDILKIDCFLGIIFCNIQFPKNRILSFAALTWLRFRY